mmetsp:Transcript_19086/g.34713  ORF Transcript_19086/g.34713 Transcript_19086/m.34713 type:complete len:249 (+) Transcript_19086:2981-3727(+)
MSLCLLSASTASSCLDRSIMTCMSFSLSLKSSASLLWSLSASSVKICPTSDLSALSHKAALIWSNEVISALLSRAPITLCKTAWSAFRASAASTSAFEVFLFIAVCKRSSINLKESSTSREVAFSFTSEMRSSTTVMVSSLVSDFAMSSAKLSTFLLSFSCSTWMSLILLSVSLNSSLYPRLTMSSASPLLSLSLSLLSKADDKPKISSLTRARCSALSIDLVVSIDWRSLLFGLAASPRSSSEMAVD